MAVRLAALTARRAVLTPLLTALLTAVLTVGTTVTAHNALAAASTDPGCRVHIGDVRVTDHVGHRHRHRHRNQMAEVGAYLACAHRVHHMSLQVTLWKAGLLYDHEQAQTTVHAAAGRHLAGDPAHVRCRRHTTSRFYGVAHAIVYFRGKRGDAWVKSPGVTAPQCGT